MKVCPNNLDLLLRIDSTAAIGAISKGPVSERKRIRAAGRAWLNLCRSDYSKKSKDIRIEHVSSHKGTLTTEQIGNDAADALANEFRVKGERENPVPYLMASEEPLIFQHNERIVQGDPRIFLKQLEKRKMTEDWISKSPKQAAWFIKHPTQILKQAKQVWRWAVETGQGKAWLYFVFAICQWLPTNYRMSYFLGDLEKRCKLCLCNSADTMEHLLVCPALATEHLLLKEEMKLKLHLWDIPYSSMSMNSYENDSRMQWHRAAREKFSLATLPAFRLDLLTKGYWKANSNKQFISTPKFLDDLSRVVSHQQPLQSYHPRADLLAILIQEFALQTQGFSDSMNFSPGFDEWTSTNTGDIPFGAELWTFAAMHGGRNTFFFRAPNHSADTQGLLGIIAESLETKAPTRAVCLIPKQENLPHSFLELFTIQASCPLFGYDQSVESVSPCDMSVVLSLNKESMVIDPIQWDSFTSKIRCWSQYWPPDSVSLSQRTCDLFRERVSLSHLPRTLSKQPQNVILKSSSALCFYDAFSSKRPITASSTSIPSWAVKLFNKINKHPCFLGVLGILPNQLRSLLKVSGHTAREEALLDISRTLFFAGFRVWTKRQKLAAQYWRDVAPENKKRIAKKQKPETKLAQTKCKNPFHFLCRHSNFSKQRQTRCPCSIVKNTSKISVSQPITKFLFKLPSLSLSSRWKGFSNNEE